MNQHRLSIGRARLAVKGCLLSTAAKLPCTLVTSELLVRIPALELAFAVAA